MYESPAASTTRLYRNDLADGNWLKVALQGAQAEWHGLGSRVTIVAGGRRQMRQIDGGGSGHLSHNSPIAHFGLGAVSQIDSLIIDWTGGERQVLTDQPVNQLLTVVEPERSGFGKVVFWGALAGVLALGLIIYQRQKARTRHREV